MSSGGSTASKRADGCAVRGKTKGKVCQENNMAAKGKMVDIKEKL